MNLYEASLTGRTLTLGSQSFELPEQIFTTRPSLVGAEARKLIVGIRPEDIDDASVTHKPDFVEIAAGVTLVEALGAETMVHLAIDAPWVDAGDPDAMTEIGADRSAVGRFSPKTSVRPGDTARLAISAENLHFFAPESRTSIW
jgi:multiple sugar transport system ATP-binding protein